MPRSRTTTIVLALFTVAAVGYIMFVPARNYLDQQSATRDAERELEQLDAEIAELEQRQVDLTDPDHIAEVAREDFGLGRPDEQVFAVLPAPPAPLPIPTGWPFDSLRAAAAASTGVATSTD
jgi:cell division protein FtsL